MKILKIFHFPKKRRKKKMKKSKVNESSSPEGRLMRGEEECDL